MKRMIQWQVFSISITIAALLTWGLHAVSGMSFWVSLGVVIAAILINGIIATIEDEMPGGFNNPAPATSQSRVRIASRATERFLHAVAGLRKRTRP